MDKDASKLERGAGGIQAAESTATAVNKLAIGNEKLFGLSNYTKSKGDGLSNTAVGIQGSGATLGAFGSGLGTAVSGRDTYKKYKEGKKYEAGLSAAETVQGGLGTVDKGMKAVHGLNNIGKMGDATKLAGTAANVSTVKPDHTTLTTPTESDQYQWKYMYSISASDVIKFVTNDFLPIKTMGAKLAVHGGVSNAAGDNDGRLGDAATDDGSAQWDVENGAVDGALDKVRVIAAGSGYTVSTSTALIAIRGDGASGVATVVTNGSGGVSSCSITTAGSGYTTAYIANEDIPGFDNASQSADGSNVSANIEFIIPPKNGHGADPITELGANYVILNSRLEYAEGSGDFPTDNDFRQIGVVVNPTDSGGNTLCTATTRTAYKKMTFVSGGFAAPTVDTFVRNASTEEETSAVVFVVVVGCANIRTDCN
jgi:hypothetical protein